eukprot:469298-Pelagomonas_calceolata.AAC.1
MRLWSARLSLCSLDRRGLDKGPAYSESSGCSGALTQTYLADLSESGPSDVLAWGWAASSKASHVVSWKGLPS